MIFRDNIQSVQLGQHLTSGRRYCRLQSMLVIRRLYGSLFALFCRRVTTVSDALTAIFRQINRVLDAVWRYGIAQTACVDVSRPCQTAR